MAPKKAVKPSAFAAAAANAGKKKQATKTCDDEEAAQGAALLEEAMLSFRGVRAPEEVKVAVAAPPLEQVKETYMPIAEEAPASAVLSPVSSGTPQVLSKSLYVEPTGRWDDGATCVDKPGGFILQCSRCGNRPRPAHEFRCRLHDEDLSNGDERPAYPSNVDDKMAMRRYAKDMDEWQPDWLDVDEEEAAPVDDGAYPLPCPRCDCKTEQCGVAGVLFATNMQRIMVATEWLPSEYEGAVNAPTPTPDRSFHIAMGTWGRCLKCKLLVSVLPVEST